MPSPRDLVIRNGGLSCLLGILLVVAASSFAQTDPRVTPIPPAGVPAPNASPAPAPQPDYAVAGFVLGPGDVVEIRVADSPEISGKYLITDKGELELPLLPGPVKAAGLTTLELSKSIGKALKAADILKEPAVNVFVAEYHSRSVTVLGAVNRPGLYPLARRTTLLELLSQAGGLMPNAGNMLTIAREMKSSGTAPSPQPAEAPVSDKSLIVIDVPNLVSGRDASLNVEAKPGDVVSVSTASVVYVVGAVTKPGGFALQADRAELTVLQVLALSEGLKPEASPGHSIIVRRSASATDRQEIPVDIRKMMSGRDKDQVLQANDILFVPESGTKKGVRRMGDIAVQSVATIVGYGIGLRVGGRR